MDVHAECLWVAFTPNLRGRLDALDSGLAFPELLALQRDKAGALKGTKLAVGQPVRVVVTDTDRERHHLDVAVAEDPKDIEARRRRRGRRRLRPKRCHQNRGVDVCLPGKTC